MNGNASGRVVYLTGGASGLGDALARRFAAAGDIVAIADIDGDRAAALAAELPGAFAVTVDIADPGSVRASVAETETRAGRIDVVLNNAGIVGDQLPLDRMDDAAWYKVTKINGDGAFFVLREGIAALLRGGGGCVLNTASTVGLAAFVNLSHYTYAKAGLIGLTRSAAIEYAARDIRVNAIAPTMVLTPLVEGFLNAADDPELAWAEARRMNPMPGMPTPEDVAGIAFFLCSPEAKWINGHTVPIDGGYMAR